MSCLLYVMGRNGHGPIGRFFGYIHPNVPDARLRHHLHGFRVAVRDRAESGLRGLVDQLRCADRVHLREPDDYSLLPTADARDAHPREIFRNIVLPGIGVSLTVLLWLYLRRSRIRHGMIWFGIGIIVLLWITRFFKRPMNVNMGEAPITRGRLRAAVLGVARRGGATVVDPATGVWPER